MISSYQLHYSAVALGVSIGLFVPLLSNILPIMRALSKTLRDSLDLYHRTIDEITVSVVKLEKLGLSIDQTMTALLLVVMGFVCYYLAP
jgi:DNA-binding IclR family transcriptional regulator